MIYFNKDKIRDKIYACWIGKNIGGTIGTPFEGVKELMDIKGFTSPKGSALPNDDLDLQLVWLKAISEKGPNAINSKLLSDYWLNCIGPNWNEYGVSKANKRMGLLPPLSGELYNEQWKDSNGAWIRTEIWACTNPGCPENAIRFAFEDACVDHGFGEGTYATIFVAAMESAAFIIDDVRTLINIGLSKIPNDCRVSKSVRIVLDAYDKKIDWKTTRKLVVEDSADLGWFQAPANIAFIILGLLYGEGDFKKSMLLTVNCGDDTDCTGATIGSIMGIVYGTSIIPDDWRSYIGDSIVTCCIIAGSGDYPKSCNQLTDCVMRLIPVCTQVPLGEYFNEGEKILIGEEADDFSQIKFDVFCGDGFVKNTFKRSHFSFTMESTFYTALIEFERQPVISANGTLKLKVGIKNNSISPRQNHFDLKWYLPEGWKVEGRNHVFEDGQEFNRTQHAVSEITIVAGEEVCANNRIILEMCPTDRTTPILIPITVLG